MDDWEFQCFALFAICVIAVALVVAHYTVGMP
jgi:hypothetical protein